MNKLINKLWLLIALLFTANCVNVSDDSERDDSSESNIKIGTLCAYRWIWSSHVREGARVLHDVAQLTSLLDSTGYDANTAIKKMAHQPDFKKWTYFAFAGPDWRRDIDISYGKDTVFINYITYVIPCDGRDHAAPLPVVVVSFIPFTDKTVEFIRTSKPMDGCPYEEN